MLVVKAKQERIHVPKPPKTTPHSDLDGVHEDERGNVETAAEAGQDSGDLETAKKEAKGRPPYSDDQGKGDDRTR